MTGLTVPAEALAFFGGIGAILGGAISLLFFRLIGSYEKRIQECDDRAKAAEQRTLDAEDRELEWQKRAWEAIRNVAQPALAELKEERRRRNPR